MSVPEPVILCDPFYHSSNWFQEIIAGFRDAAAKDRNNSPIHIHSMGTIGQLRLEPGIPVIVTNSSLKNLTSAVQQLRQAGIPVILSGVDGAHFGSDIYSVASDSALAMTQMVRYLLSYDRKRIALAGFWSSSRNDMAFLDAAVAAADRFGYPISPQSIFLWENQLDESLNAFFQKHEDYNAVICPNDTIAICLTRACRERDIRIPETLFVTGASNMRISQKFEPSITTISMDFREIGKETYYVREHLIRRESKCSRISVSIPACIIPRESTGNLSLKEALPQAGSQCVSTFESGNNFFTNPTINSLIRFENCLSNRDEIDQKIVMAILQGKSYEQMEEMLFMSGSAIRYRRSRIFRDAGVSNRAEFEQLLTSLYSI